MVSIFDKTDFMTNDVCYKKNMHFFKYWLWK